MLNASIKPNTFSTAHMIRETLVNQIQRNLIVDLHIVSVGHLSVARLIWNRTVYRYTCKCTDQTVIAYYAIKVYHSVNTHQFALSSNPQVTRPCYNFVNSTLDPFRLTFHCGYIPRWLSRFTAWVMLKCMTKIPSYAPVSLRS